MTGRFCLIPAGLAMVVAAVIVGPACAQGGGGFADRLGALRPEHKMSDWLGPGSAGRAVRNAPAEGGEAGQTGQSEPSATPGGAPRYGTSILRPGPAP